MEGFNEHIIREIMESYGCNIISAISLDEPIEFKCKCGKKRYIIFSDFFTDVCNKCGRPRDTFTDEEDNKNTIKIKKERKIVDKQKKAEEKKVEIKIVDKPKNSKLPEKKEEQTHKNIIKNIVEVLEPRFSKSVFVNSLEISDLLYSEEEQINNIKFMINLKNINTPEFIEIKNHKSNANEIVNNVITKLNNKGCLIGTEITKITSSNTRLLYMCICKEIKIQQIKYINNNKNCKNCERLLNEFEKQLTFEQYRQLVDILDSKNAEDITDLDIKNKLKIIKHLYKRDVIIQNTGEIWRKIPGAWISSFGFAKNYLGEELTLCLEKHRYYINGDHRYLSRLSGITFKIPEYEKVLVENDYYGISCIDKSIELPRRYKPENLKILSSKEYGEISGKKARKSENFKEKLNTSLSDYLTKFRYVVLKNLLPEYIIFETGEIYSEPAGRFLTFSLSSENRLKVNINEKCYFVHRLLCFAFNKLPDKNNYKDYDNLQVNHINGNTLDNNASNLEWTTQSENMQHAYDNDLNKKRRDVLCYNKITGVLEGEYISIAEASRKKNDTEYGIRKSAQNDGKNLVNNTYNWKFKYPEQTEEYRKKYSSKPKKK